MNRTRGAIRSLVTPVARPFVRQFVEKPWASPTMEFQYGLWNGVSCLYSAAGRQLGEASARPHLFNDEQSAQWRESRYAGVRAGRQINVSALRIAMAHFDEALAVVGAVRATLLAREKRPVTDDLGLWDLYLLSRLSIALIAYGVRSGHLENTGRSSRSREPVVPTVLATQFQFISGIFMICRHMIETDAPEISQNTVVSAAALYDYADSHGVFLSPSGGACAGSRAFILQFVQFCIDGVKTGAHCVEAGEPARILGRDVGDVAGWLSYGAQTIALECTIDAAIPGTPSAATRIFKAFTARADRLSPPALSAPMPVAVREGTPPGLDLILARQNAILRLLGRGPVSAIAPKIIAVRMKPIKEKETPL
ncbi:MAG: hypothetical protein AAFQ29_12725 [Pseudomonadota bacterium]